MFNYYKKQFIYLVRVVFVFSFFISLHPDAWAFDSSVDAKGLSSSVIRQRIIEGDILTFRFVKAYSTAFAISDQIVLGWKAQNTHVGMVGKIKAAAYPNTSTEITASNAISIWGAIFNLDIIAGKTCLAKSGVCYAELLGSIFDANFQPSMYLTVINGSITDLKNAANQTLLSLCTKNGVEIFPNFVKYRDIGEALHRIVPLVNIIPFKDTRDAFWNDVLTQVNYLTTSYNTSFSNTEYAKCNGSTEFMTGYLVMKGINQVYNIQPTTQLKTYVTNIFNDIYLSSHAVTVRNLVNTANSSSSLGVYANMHSQYLGAQLIMKKIGARPLDTHIDGVIKNIIRAQSLNNGNESTSFLNNQDQCIQNVNEANVAYTLQFGGWAHGVNLVSGLGDCRQTMSYHSLTLDPLVEFISMTNADASICSSTSFSYSCTQTQWSVRAALAYFTNSNVQDSVGKYLYGHAFGSTNSNMFESGRYYGSTFGADVGYRALAVVSFPSARVSFDATQRVTREQIMDSLNAAAAYTMNSKRNYSYLASWALMKLNSVSSTPIQI